MKMDCRILNPILQELKPPKGCPVLDFRSEISHTGGLDIRGGYTEMPNNMGITCIPVRIANEKGETHPACKDCKIARTLICDMKEYNRRLEPRK